MATKGQKEKKIKQLDVAIDLGSESVKIVYAYKKARNWEVGKFSTDSSIGKNGIPAVALYDTNKGIWHYGEQVEESGIEDFTTVVRIKFLMELNKTRENKAEEERNRELYETGNVFPKYFLPNERVWENGFTEEKADCTFKVTGCTPKQVCEEFFRYLKATVETWIQKLEAKEGVKFSTIHYSFVYPLNTGAENEEETERLFKAGFDQEPKLSLNTTKAISVCAYEMGKVKIGEKFLVFDVGEEYVSCSKAWVEKGGKPRLDGLEGHSKPERLGGLDIDAAMLNQLLENISKKETFGTPSNGKDGHITEGCVKSQKYRLLNEIKKAKALLSLSGNKELNYMLHVVQDVYVLSHISLEEVKTGARAIQQRLRDYIVEELAQPLNRDVEKILLAGGAAKTYGLAQYVDLQTRTRSAIPALLCEGDVGEKASDEFAISSNETCVYAAAMGCALAAAKDLDVRSVLSLSYGVWIMPKGERLFSFLAGKGEMLNKKGETPFLEKYDLWNISEKIESKIYSINLSRKDVAARKGEDKGMELYRNVYSQCYLFIDEPNTERRRKLERPNVAGLKTLVGLDENGKDVNAQLYYKGEWVCIKFVDYNDTTFSIREGIIAQHDGRARVVVENDKEKNRGRYVYVARRGAKGKGWSKFDETNPIELSEIEIRFPKAEISLEEN